MLKQTEAKPNYSYNVKVDGLKAPVKRGDIVGNVEVVDESGNVVDTLDVTVRQDVSKASIWDLFVRNFKMVTAGKVLIK